MKTFITAVFWLTVAVVGFGYCISSLFGLLPILFVGAFSPFLAMGLLFGIAISGRRH
jgi:hypothetical protein